MRHRLALLAPAAWLALAGATPLPIAPIDPLLECRLSPDQARAAIGALPAGTRREGKGYQFTAHAVPGDAHIFGYVPAMLASNASIEPGVEEFGLLSVVNAPFDEVEGHVLAGQGLSDCPHRASHQDRNCVAFSKEEDDWRTMLIVQEFDDGHVGISCNYRHLVN